MSEMAGTEVPQYDISGDIAMLLGQKDLEIAKLRAQLRMVESELQRTRQSGPGGMFVAPNVEHVGIITEPAAAPPASLRAVPSDEVVDVTAETLHQ